MKTMARMKMLKESQDDLEELWHGLRYKMNVKIIWKDVKNYGAD